MRPGCDNVACCDVTFAPVAAVMPFHSGETDPSASCVMTQEQAFLDWMDIHWTSNYAYTRDTWSPLISGYNGTPKSPWVAVEARLQALG